MKPANFENWIDLDGVEEERTYHFPDGSTYTVVKPSKLFVKKSGSHKLVDANGLNHYVKSGWNAFTFKGTFEFNVE
tara:strand:+ start:496 stop:723 length:228 start_codon:yes stop_codon:yes gene_type:complete